MSLSSGTGKLAHGLKSLRANWDATQTDWKDEIRQEFEESHLQPVEQELLATVNAIGTLDQILIKALQECE